MDIQKLKQDFRNTFNAEPLIVKSPGRINVIGEHIDYNDGFVMPAAINKAIYVAISLRTDDQIHLYSENYKAHYTASVSALKKSDLNWANYILGVVDQLIEKGFKLGGFNFYFFGDIPLGAGLSSSAALECATAFALNELNRLRVSKMDLALISQKAEQRFAGVNCGIMDQFASVFGKKDYAMLLDCRNMEYQYIPMELKGYKFLLLNTKIKHALSDSAYNKRRMQCELGVSWINSHNPNVNSLRDANIEMLDDFVKSIDDDVYQKCKFVVEETIRTKNAALMLKDGDLNGLGTLMYETHEGLSKAYEVSCPELDFLVDKVKNVPAVLGARMMGGGFGGCTINIVKEEEIDALVDQLKPLYFEQFGLALEAYIVETDNGSEIIA